MKLSNDPLKATLKPAYRLIRERVLALAKLKSLG